MQEGRSLLPARGQEEHHPGGGQGDPGRRCGQTVDDPYITFVKMLPDKDCHYALYDAAHETKESKKKDLVFIFWAPETASLKSKIIYASSEDAIKKKLTGIKHELPANFYEEVKDCGTLAEKLGSATQGPQLPGSFQSSP
ncbi:hypothetical protein ACRRTK_003303 [Alexandromys fortis]